MNDTLIPFNFQGDDLLLAEVDGKAHIVLKPAIEAIGLDYKNQYEKLRAKSWATMVLSTTVASDGRKREMTAVDVRTFLMLLATIDENRVAEHARPKLIAYQSEVADAIEQYWTEGGVINPRATEDQVDAIIGRARAQASVLKELKGLVSREWLEAKARHVAARALGEEPEVEHLDRPLTVGEYLEDKGVGGEALRSLSPKFGKQLKAEFVDRYDRQPPTVERFVSGALRSVAAYTERHRPLFDRVWAGLSGAVAV